MGRRLYVSGHTTKISDGDDPMTFSSSVNRIFMEDDSNWIPQEIFSKENGHLKTFLFLTKLKIFLDRLRESNTQLLT